MKDWTKLCAAVNSLLKEATWKKQPEKKEEDQSSKESGKWSDMIEDAQEIDIKIDLACTNCPFKDEAHTKLMCPNICNKGKWTVHEHSMCWLCKRKVSGKCFNCGSKDHLRRECSQPPKCFHCGESDHLEKSSYFLIKLSKLSKLSLNYLIV